MFILYGGCFWILPEISDASLAFRVDVGCWVNRKGKLGAILPGSGALSPLLAERAY